MAMNVTTNYGFPKPEFDDQGSTKADEFKTAQDTADTAVKAAVDAKVSASIVDYKGDIIAATAADTVARVAVGTDGKFLKADSGAAAGVSWDTPPGGGDCVAPSSSTDDTLARWDGTDSKTLQDSGVTLDDNDDFSGQRAFVYDLNLSDDSYQGKVISAQAGESLSQWDVVYMKSDGKFWKAKADADATMYGMAIAVEAITAESYGRFLRNGLARNDGWSFSTPGASVFVDPSTAGAITTTQPSTTGQQVQIIGEVLKANVVDFHFCPVVVEIG